MVKNVKVEENCHQLLSIRAAEMNVKKSDLASALIAAGLELLPREVINSYVFMVTSHAINANRNTEREHG